VSAIETVPVELGERGYDIVVGEGVLATAGKYLGPILRRPVTVVVTDDIVAGLHLETLGRALDDAGISHRDVVIDSGESTKDFAHLERLIDRLLEARVERGDVIVALGGGVVGDLAGFAASILRRGVDFVQVPTTLLAQVDSSVGGKTGINSRHGKNLIGSFHQPRLVLADVGTLATLPRRDLLAGYAETVKYGVLGDAVFFAWLEENGTRLCDGDVDALRHAVVTGCQMKARLVAADERETGARALLNLGHTFGHALEAESGYGAKLLHGEAVAVGMVLAAELSARLGHCGAEVPARLRRHLAAVGLPTTPTALLAEARPDADAFLARMFQDKKVTDGTLTFVLVRDIGEAFLSREVTPEDVLAVLEGELAA
jgi:3-dehydroquinate synthase